MNIVEVERLTKRYGQENAAEELSFALEEGTATALIGPNGAGKTTTLSMLADLLSPTSGKVTMAKGLTIGFLPQYPQFFPWLTALEFTEMAAKLSGVETKKARLQATRTLEFVGLGTALTKKTGAFSGGMKQRLGLAQAIVHQPKLLLLDEPISALDPTGRREIMDLLKSLQQDTTILYSTHILNDAEEMTDQLLFMKDGRLIEQGSLSEVRDRHANPRIRIRFQNYAQAVEFAEGQAWGSEVKENSIFLPVQKSGPTMQQVLQVLASKKQDVLGVEFQTASLEEIFLKVVAGK
ncbi:ATP-binding cassette domain-containing protein [Planococcus sp. SE5232]|uniref:ABC transporter ATP-binding protein n=1 Tax=unclassified Planococcus (in: firmicutes) TaxID=2662419 RepID=UPI001CBA8FF1|nr:ABC transporter ATP-binding protein [Planococcus sp. 4-30]